MARKEKGKGRSGLLAAALAGGDHRAARAEARGLLADPAAPEAERAEAARVLASLAPERAAVLCGAASLLVAIALAAWVLTRG
jgi:hypothetical protein